MIQKFLLFLFIICTLLAQEEYGDEEDYPEEDLMSVGGGTQQTCDGCRTVMDQLLQEWHTIDNDSFLEAIDEASHINEYVPVIPEDEVNEFILYLWNRKSVTNLKKWL